MKKRWIAGVLVVAVNVQTVFGVGAGYGTSHINAATGSGTDENYKV